MADKSKTRLTARLARHRRIRKKMRGSAARPRLCVRRSISNMYAQIVDDDTGKSLVQVSSLAKEIRGEADGKNKTELSQAVGRLLAEKAKAAGISRVVFDRGGYLYHGRVKAVAEAAREAGLDF